MTTTNLMITEWKLSNFSKRMKIRRSMQILSCLTFIAQMMISLRFLVNSNTVSKKYFRLLLIDVTLRRKMIVRANKKLMTGYLRSTFLSQKTLNNLFLMNLATTKLKSLLNFYSTGCQIIKNQRLGEQFKEHKSTRMTNTFIQES